MLELSAAPLLLRPFVASDAPEFVTALRESMDTLGVWMSWASPAYTLEQAREWFAICESDRSSGISNEFGIFEADGRLIGGAGLNQFNALHKFCNLGYWVRASAQRKGAAVAASRSLLSLTFEQHAQSRVEIVVAEGNTNSRMVAERLGATYECLAETVCSFRERQWLRMFILWFLNVRPNPRFERTRSIWLRRAFISFWARRSQMERAAQPKR